MAEQKFPSEVIDLPSKGNLYSEGHPCKDGKIEIKYMIKKTLEIKSRVFLFYIYLYMK